MYVCMYVRRGEERRGEERKGLCFWKRAERSLVHDKAQPSVTYMYVCMYVCMYYFEEWSQPYPVLYVCMYVCCVPSLP